MPFASATTPLTADTPRNAIGPASASTAAGHDDVLSHLQKSQLYRDYEQAFQATTGLPLVLRRVGSLHSPLLGSKQASPFCAVMAARNKSCAACLRLQQEVEEKACREACTLECFAGLSESAVPIRVGDTVIGYLQTGQVLLQHPTEAGFKQVARRVDELGADVDLPQLKTAYLHTRVVPKMQYEGVVRLLAIFGQHLSQVSNELITKQQTAESPVISRARTYINEHLDEDLTLAELAKVARMSPHYFCKMFKKSVGVNFVDYLARVRVEKVKQLLLNPHVRISEAAFAVGFQSLSQFNRTFRRVVGESPTHFRDHLHSGAPLVRAA